MKKTIELDPAVVAEELAKNRGGYNDISREAFDRDIKAAQEGLYVHPEKGGIYSRVRNPGPGLAGKRLEDRGVDVEQLIKQKFQRPETVNKAKGGSIKGYAKGGSVSSKASSRADGCAQRGKTKGRFV